MKTRFEKFRNENLFERAKKPALRFGFAAALVFVLLFSGIAYGKDSFAAGLGGMTELTAEIKKAPAELFKEFFSWLGESIILIPRKIGEGIKEIPRIITQPLKKEVPAEIVSPPPAAEETAKKEIYPELAERVGELKSQNEELRQKIEKLEKEGLPAKEIIKEVSKITQIEPVKEIVKETIRIDEKETSWLKEKVSQFSQIAQKLQANPQNTSAPTSPIYIGSQGIQVGGAGVFSSLGVSGSAGFKDLGVGDSATLGENSSDKLTVNSTASFTSPVSVSNTLTTTGSISTGGNLTVTGAISAGPLNVSATSSSSILSVTQSGTGNIVEFFDATNTVFVIKDGGNVGIGTTTPAYKLDVVGDVNVTGSINEGGSTLSIKYGTLSPGSMFPQDIGKNWVNPGSVGIGIRGLVSAGSGIVIASSYMSGGINHIYRSTDYGLTWADVGVIAPNIFALSYLGSGRALLGSGNGHIYRSTDFGITWSDVGGIGSGIYSILYLGSGIVVAGDGDNGHIYRSIDYGLTWTDVGAITPYYTLINGYLGNGTVIASGTNDSGEYLFRSTDYGLTWTNIGTAYLDVNMSYFGNGVAVYGDSDGHVFRSTNAGLNWTDLGDIRGAGKNINTISYAGNGVVIFGDSNGDGSGTAWKSTDYGLTWSQITGLTMDVRHSSYLGNGVVIFGGPYGNLLISDIAYKLDETHVGMEGFGASGYISKFNVSKILATSTIYQSGDNVGIGNINPIERLDVSGNIRFGQAPTTYTTTTEAIGSASTTIPVVSTSGYPSAGTILIDSEAITYATTTATAFGGLTRAVLGTATSTHATSTQVKNYIFTALASSTTPRMVITGDGNVGIGTTGPTSLLEIYSSTADTKLTVTAATSTDSMIVFRTGAAPATQALIGIDYSDSNKLKLVRGSDIATSTGITIDSLGNVGIGTTTPATTFQVYGTSTFMGGNVGIGTTNPSSLLHIKGTQAGQVRLERTDTGGTWELRMPVGAGGADFSIYDVDNATTVLVIAKDNNYVGIGRGLTNPASPLEVLAGDGLGGDGILISGAGSSSPALLFSKDGGSLTAEIGTVLRANDFLSGSAVNDMAINSDGSGGLLFGLNGVEKMRIASSTGYVGIGTVSPGRKLDVLDASAAQLRLTYTNESVYTDFTLDTNGNLIINPAKNTYLKYSGNTGANLWVCEGTACPDAGTSMGSTGGNLVVEGGIYGGTRCPSDMVYVPGDRPFCIDKFESYNAGGAVVNDTCTNGSQAEVDANTTTAVAGSASGTVPLASLNWCAAKKACQNAGKHLCTNQEWFQSCNYKGGQWNITAEETAEAMSCNTASEGTPSNTGNNPGCVTQEGAYDMIGNVWEWVDKVVTADPTNGLTNSYVTGYDFATALPASTSAASSNAYGNDYFWAYNGAGAARAAIRGGYWNNGAGAGCFTLSLDAAPSGTYTGIGFRCCQ